MKHQLLIKDGLRIPIEICEMLNSKYGDNEWERYNYDDEINRKTFENDMSWSYKNNKDIILYDDNETPIKLLYWLMFATPNIQLVSKVYNEYGEYSFIMEDNYES